MFIACSEDTPVYPGSHNLWSRYWISDELEGARLGEDPAAVRRYHSGAPLGFVPPARLLGSAECIADGERWPLSVVPDLVGGFNVLCGEDVPAPLMAFHVLDPRNWCYWALRARQCYSNPAGLLTQLAADYGVPEVGRVHASTNALPPTFAFLTPPMPAPWVLVIAGTTNALQWIAQIGYGFEAPTDFGQYATHRVWEFIVREMMNELLDLNPDPAQPIVIVGHSLGGALACIVAAKLRLFAPQREIQVLLFGCPRAGDRRLRDIVGTCQVVNIATEEDVICSLPLQAVEIPVSILALLGRNFGRPANDWTQPPNRVTVAVDGTRLEGALAPGPPEAVTAFALWYLGLGLLPEVAPHLPSEYVRRLCLNENPAAAALWGDGAAVLAAAALPDEEVTTVLTGSILPFAGPLTPTGYLLCDGTEFPIVDYPELFGAIGSTWDTFRGQAAPAAGNFRVPLLSGLALVGAGDPAGSPATGPYALGDVVGEEKHTLVTAELSIHSHGVTDPGHSHLAASGYNLLSSYQGILNVAAGADFAVYQIGPTDTRTTGLTVDNAGGNQPHENRQPSAVIKWVIKT